jgi:hypothetical protein
MDTHSDAEYRALRDRLQIRAARWIATGGELAERGWWLFELLAWIERHSSPSADVEAAQRPAAATGESAASDDGVACAPDSSSKP